AVRLKQDHRTLRNSGQFIPRVRPRRACLIPTYESRPLTDASSDPPSQRRSVPCSMTTSTSFGSSAPRAYDPKTYTSSTRPSGQPPFPSRVIMSVSSRVARSRLIRPRPRHTRHGTPVPPRNGTRDRTRLTVLPRPPDHLRRGPPPLQLILLNRGGEISRNLPPVHHTRHSNLREGTPKRLQPGPSQKPAGLTHRRADQSDPAKLLRLINTEPELVRPSVPASARRTRPTQQRHQDSNKTLLTPITHKRRHPPTIARHDTAPPGVSPHPPTGATPTTHRTTPASTDKTTPRPPPACGPPARQLPAVPPFAVRRSTTARAGMSGLVEHRPPADRVCALARGHSTTFRSPHNLR